MLESLAGTFADIAINATCWRLNLVNLSALPFSKPKLLMCGSGKAGLESTMSLLQRGDDQPGGKVQGDDTDNTASS